MRTLALVFLLGCGGHPRTAIDAPRDAAADASCDAADDGFGMPCTPIVNTLTPCTSCDGKAGWCAINACRRQCNRADLSGCPTGQTAIPTIQDGCYCVPLDAGM